jgi:hypothetical protein
LKSTLKGEFSPCSYSFLTTVISLSRSFFAMIEFTMRSASSSIAHARLSSPAWKSSK